MKKIDSELSEILASGGDHRLKIDFNERNAYGVGVKPECDSFLNFSSSTGSTISNEAYQYLLSYWKAISPSLDYSVFSDELQKVRNDIRLILGLSDDIDIVFSSSGTDSEFLFPIISYIEKKKPVNYMSLCEEIGSNSILAARGLHITEDKPFEKRNNKSGVVLDFDVEVKKLAYQDYMPELKNTEESYILHQVYMSKTGKIWPKKDQLYSLRDSAHVVIDACQGRIERDLIKEYLTNEYIVMLTGSKFFGGQPFSGITLFPSYYKRYFEKESGLVCEGLDFYFTRSYFPKKWVAFDNIQKNTNPGLLLRLKSATFEMKRYFSVHKDRRNTIIDEYASEFLRVFNSKDYFLAYYNECQTQSNLMKTIINVKCEKLDNESIVDAYARLKLHLNNLNISVGQCVKSEGVFFRVSIGARNIYNLAGYLESDRKRIISEEVNHLVGSITAFMESEFFC